MGQWHRIEVTVSAAEHDLLLSRMAEHTGQTTGETNRRETIVAALRGLGTHPQAATAPRRTTRPRSFLHPSAEVQPAPCGHLGVFATRPITEGTLVALWAGDYVSESELHRLSAAVQPYAVQVENDWFLVPSDGVLHEAEYFNHSCEPSCGMSGQVGLITMRDIAPGEELTFDYAMVELEPQSFVCRCGTPSCRGTLGRDDALSADLRRRYRGFFSPWIARRIAALEAGTVTTP